MIYKRITLLCGHYGSGKTNIAVNMAYDLKKQNEKVLIADLDIVNPYFRTKDSAGEFEDLGIRLICSEYAGSNVDIPALPQEMYSLTDDKTVRAVIDVGGDDRGALALGRISPQIMAENDYEAASQRDPLNVDYRVNRVELLLLLKKPEEARAQLDILSKQGIPQGVLVPWYRRIRKK